MREIKFRAWDTLAKKWPRDFTDVVDPAGKGGNVTLLRHADHIELMQFTGLKDKDGKEIYVGDIVVFSGRSERSAPYEVKFEGAQFKAVRPEKMNQCGLIDTEQWLEVIGNIYENHELLKV